MLNLKKRMAASKKPAKPPVVGLRHPVQYVLSFLANRFAVAREDGFVLAHFGLVTKADVLIDRFTVVITDNTLKTLKENLVKYSDEVGLPKKEIPKWLPPARKAEESISLLSYLPVVDFLHLCHGNDVDPVDAEICFWSYSQAYASDLSRVGKDQTLMPWGIALMRCEIDLQRAFLAELYPV
jgi:hypothetical protein